MSIQNIYVIPPISDEKYLPDSSIPFGYISNKIEITGSPGEFVPATFIIKAGTAISGVIPTPSNLVSDLGDIPSSILDIYAVKCWWQSYPSKNLTPELLLKDDTLVKVENGENYLKMSDGSYMWISDPTPTTDPYKRWSVDEISVIDADNLQPTDIPAGTNKQFWVLAKIPENTPAGMYSGTIDLQTATINVLLNVLPINLLDTYMEYGIFYTARLSNSYPLGTISSHNKSEEQLRAEMKDCYEHGIKSPTVYQGIYEDPVQNNLIARFLEIMKEAGLGEKPIYYIGQGPRYNTDPAIVPNILSLAVNAGFPDVYFYGEDESLGHRVDADGNPLTSAETVQKCADQIPAWEQIHALGGKVFVSGVRVNYYSDARSVGEFGIAGDQIDLFNAYKEPTQQEAARWHSIGHKIVDYANPVIGQEKPALYRRNYGLLLWQKDYDGAMPWAYNYATGNPWNDFDSSMGQMFGYPTINGVVDNLAFEGWREGVTDTRYLTTLIHAIETSPMDTTAAESFLANLKTTNLDTLDLDEVRMQMINHILSLQEEGNGGNIFQPGESKVARARITVAPAGLNCTAEIFLGVIDTDKVATSGLIPFSSTGSSQEITFPITMPLQTGRFHVYIDLKVEGTLVAAFIAEEDVTIEGTPVPGNTALLFAPPDSYVDCGNIPVPSGPYTIELWVSPQIPGEFTTNNGPLAKATAGPPEEWSWQVRYDKQIGYMGFQFNTPNGPVWVRTNKVLERGKNYYLVARFDGSTVECLVGDTALEIVDSAVMSSIIDTGAPVLIGQDGWGQIFEGIVDEIRISNSYRSDSELSQNWNNGAGRKMLSDAHTIALYHLDEGEGNTILDSSPNHFDGVIHNATWVDGLI